MKRSTYGLFQEFYLSKTVKQSIVHGLFPVAHEPSQHAIRAETLCDSYQEFVGGRKEFCINLLGFLLLAKKLRLSTH